MKIENPYIKNPYIKNQDVLLDIDGITNEGHGVAHLEGMTFFVPGTATGDTVQAHIIKVEKRFCIAKATKILSPSSLRTEPRCKASSRCGGCAMQHMSYPEQLRQKRQFVVDSIERIGGISGINVEPTIGMPDPWRYRNKGSFPFAFLNGKAVFGFYAPKSHRLIPLEDCPIQSEPVMITAKAVAEWANECHIPVYDETTGKGNLRACIIRSTSEGQIMAVVVTKGKLKYEEELIKKLSFTDSLYHSQNDKNTNVLMGDAFRLLFGVPELQEKQLGLFFSVSPQSFLQVNHEQSIRLYRIALDYLAPESNETILDLYCGIGTITLQIAGKAKHVIGIECVPEAIENARINAKQNGIRNVEFICGNAETVLPQLMGERVFADALLLDPPRKGCEAPVLEVIKASKVERIVYVSCNPATLARDIKILSTAFAVQRVQPVDMFPQTPHVETVVAMSRVRS